MTNLYADIVAFGPTPMPDGCGCEYPGDRTAIDQYMNNNITGMRMFVGNLEYCSDPDEQQKLLNPPRPEVSWWTGALRPVYHASTSLTFDLAGSVVQVWHRGPDDPKSHPDQPIFCDPRVHRSTYACWRPLRSAPLQRPATRACAGRDRDAACGVARGSWVMGTGISLAFPAAYFLSSITCIMRWA